MVIYNTLTQKLEEFKPHTNKKVKIYVCGITPYDTTHLGHAFTYIFFDTLIRYLRFMGNDVIYTQNVTDINDRNNDILKRAQEQNISWQELANFWTKRFLDDMELLNWIMPTHYLKASKEIPSMIALIQKIINEKMGYIINGSVYLDIEMVKNFGKLSKLTKKKMIQSARAFEEDLENPDKKHPLDITLWKKTQKNQPAHIPSFDSPFGKGRPGWHLECSAMAIFSLGEQIDIHGGGNDLIFPHHESEITQSESATEKIPFAKYWMHTGTVLYKEKKMSKSMGNLVMISDLLKKYSPQAIRWVLLSHHYRKHWEFQEEELKKAEESIEKLKTLLQKKPAKTKETDDRKVFQKLMNDDINTPEVLSLITQTEDIRTLQTISTTLGFYF